MSLDDKLREIKVECYDGPFYLNDSTLSDENIAQIHQVFTDEGYHIGKQAQVTLPGYMTGQEFYDRFTNELEKAKLSWLNGRDVMSYEIDTIIEAAERAVGLE